MRYLTCLAILVASFSSVACCRGVSPSSIAQPSGASLMAVGVPERMGTRPAVYGALTVPGDVSACLANGVAKGAVVIGETLQCVLNRFVPPPVIQVQQFQAVPMAAPQPCLPAAPLSRPAPQVPVMKAPACEPCASGTCAVR